MSNFYPRSPCGERREVIAEITEAQSISIHALLAESDERSQDKRGQIQISIHALLAESDTFHQRSCIIKHNFYPRSPCGERHLRVLDGSKSSIISIHALLAESDRFFSLWCILCLYISIHALLAESDNNVKVRMICAGIFLSTLSLRRATRDTMDSSLESIISIHALLAESDGLSMLYDTTALVFLSTLSLRRATVTVLGIQHRVGISIHALLAESDNINSSVNTADLISIHALLAESDISVFWMAPNRLLFLSTLSLRRATCMTHTQKFCVSIFLSTLSLRRATWVWTGGLSYDRNFYPRSPCGERLLRKVPILGIK